MKNLPRPARVYLGLLWATALALLIWVTRDPAELLAQAPILLAGALTFALADLFEFEFEIAPRHSVVMTVADIPTLALVAISGEHGIVALVAGTLIAEYLNRRPWYKGLFNASARVLTFLTLVQMYQALTDPTAPPFSAPSAPIVCAALAITYYTLNTLFVATILGLATRRSLMQVYRDSFSSVHWVHFATTPFGPLTAILVVYNPWLLPLCAIPIVMLQRWFHTVAALQRESSRNAELAAERAQLLVELQARQDELIRSSRLAALGTFAAGIGHEFNNLLAGVLGNAELGLASDSTAEKNNALDVAVRMCLRGRSITSGLLTFARRRSSQREPTLLAGVVEETLALVERELRKEGVEIDRQIQQVPVTLCDPGQIAQVLLNLLTNARDAMRPNGGGRLTVGLEAADTTIVLTVRDTGVGIPAELRDQIFQPFVTTKGALNGSSTPGTGLGLAISYGIIESHGGTICVDSREHGGTTMTVALPIVAPPPAEDAAPALSPPPRLRVLLAEDEPGVAQALERQLAAHGHHVTIVADGARALDVATTHPFDLVISDLLMPRLGGLELTHRLLQARPGLPVLLITGQGSVLAEDVRAAGARGLLRKPFTGEQLLAAIAQCFAEAPEPLLEDQPR